MLLAGVLAVAACSGAKVNDVTGTVGKIGFKSKASVAQSASFGTEPPSYFLTIVIADYNGLCPAEAVAGGVAGGLPIAGATSLTISLTRADVPIAPGTYTVASSSSGSSSTAVSVITQLERFDGTCNETENEAATSGSIVVEGVSANAASGSVNLTFPDGTLSGSFQAAACTQAESMGTFSPSGDAGTCLALPPDAG